MKSAQLKNLNQNTFPKEIVFFLAFAVSGLIIGYLIYFLFPEKTPYIVEEGHLVENLSAFSYLVAGCLALWVMYKYNKWKKLSLMVAFLSLLGFFSELSFGADRFDLTMPSVNEIQIDAAHDLVMLVYVTAEEYIGLYGILAAVLLSGAGFLALLYYKKDYFRKVTGNIHQTVPGIFLMLFAFFLTSAVIIDLKEYNVPFAIVEELFEMYSGIALCMYSLSLANMEKRISEMNSSISGTHTSAEVAMEEPVAKKSGSHANRL